MLNKLAPRKIAVALDSFGTSQAHSLVSILLAFYAVDTNINSQHRL